MGCVSSRPKFPNDVHPNVFTVNTVTRPGNAHGLASGSTTFISSLSGGNNACGQLEVTNDELILHRRGHDAVHWPLQYVRRYGYENHLFSFESGRRCESGPGIFTFRCRRAQDLFLLVQANVQEARTPPLPAHHNHQNEQVGYDRGRSGSAASQTRYPMTTGRNPQSGSLGRRSPLNDYQVSENRSPPVSPSPSPRMNEEEGRPRNGSVFENGTTILDEVNNGQVFAEITPLRSAINNVKHGQQRRQRLSSARSQTSSSVASEHSNSNLTSAASNNKRPISFEFILSPTSSSLQDNDSNAFVSPPPSHESTANATPGSPPSSAYYVNVNPSCTTSSLCRFQKSTSPRLQYAQKNPHLNGLRRPPGRSQSLGSAGGNGDATASNNLLSSTPDRAYVNIDGGGLQISCTVNGKPAASSQENLHKIPSDLSQAENGKPLLDYVTLDVGTSGRSTWTSSTFYGRYQRRQSSSLSGNGGLSITNGFNAASWTSPTFFGSSLTSVAETGSATNGHYVVDPASSNYARIDCARTKALRETAVLAQLQRHSTSCSASSSEAVTGVGEQQFPTVGRRTRHDSCVTPGAESQPSAGKSKHHNGTVSER